MRRLAIWGCAALTLAAAACDRPVPLPESAGFGPNPTIPEPHYALIPAVALGRPAGWAPGPSVSATSTSPLGKTVSQRGSRPRASP
jgi:hypothetical protein